MFTIQSEKVEINQLLRVLKELLLTDYCAMAFIRLITIRILNDCYDLVI